MNNSPVRRTKNKKIRRFNPAPILILFVFLYLLFLLHQDINRVQKLNAEKKGVEYQITEQQKLGQELKEKIQLLNTEDYVEFIARKKLGLVKKGEVAYKIINKGGPQ